MLRMTIDPGHGEYDIGMRTNDGRTESIVTLNLAVALQDTLTDSTVLLTRGSDTYMGLPDRRRILGDRNSDLAFSLHMEYNNDERNRYGVGIYYFYQDNDSGSLGRLIAGGLQHNLKDIKVRVYPSNFFLVRRNKFTYVVRIPYLLKIPLETVAVETQAFCEAFKEAVKPVRYRNDRRH